MTLHEAIEKLLKQKGQSMTTTEIANALNRNKWYQKKDKSEISPWQIHGRTKNYPRLFNRKKSTVSLAGRLAIKPSINQENGEKGSTLLSEKTISPELLEKILMNKNNYKDASKVDDVVPNIPGIYCIQIKDANLMQNPYDKVLIDRNHTILYIGIATTSLKKRLLNQELRAVGHGTFFRSLGSALGFRPEKGSLIEKKNKRNFTFSEPDEKKIIKWINDNLLVYWVKFNENFTQVETDLIIRYKPLLNIANNPLALRVLKASRKECVEIANLKISKNKD